MNDFKTKMKEKIRIYSNKEYLDGYIKNEFLTDDGDADIFLKINEKNELFDSKSIDNQLELSSDIFSYIEDKTSMLKSDIKIHLHFLGISLTSKEKEMVKHAMKEHYAIELYKVQKEYIKYRNKIIFLICFGIFSLFVYAGFYLYTDFDFILEVCGFLFSFSLWEALDCVIYTFSDVKIVRENITQNLLMNIDFGEEKKDVS